LVGIRVVGYSCQLACRCPPLLETFAAARRCVVVGDPAEQVVGQDN
jgi:hypothetical protein